MHIRHLSRLSCPSPGRTAASSWASPLLAGAPAGARPQPAAFVGRGTSATSPDYEDRSSSLPHPPLVPGMGSVPLESRGLVCFHSEKCLQNWVMPSQSVAPEEKNGSTGCQLHALAVPCESARAHLRMHRSGAGRWLLLSVHLLALPASEQLADLLPAHLLPSPRDLPAVLPLSILSRIVCHLRIVSPSPHESVFSGFCPVIIWRLPSQSHQQPLGHLIQRRHSKGTDQNRLLSCFPPWGPCPRLPGLSS